MPAFIKFCMLLINYSESSRLFNRKLRRHKKRTSELFKFELPTTAIKIINFLQDILIDALRYFWLTYSLSEDMESSFLRNIYIFYQNTRCHIPADSKRQLKCVVHFFLKKDHIYHRRKLYAAFVSQIMKLKVAASCNNYRSGFLPS